MESNSCVEVVNAAWCQSNSSNYFNGQIGHRDVYWRWLLTLSHIPGWGRNLATDCENFHKKNLVGCVDLMSACTMRLNVEKQVLLLSFFLQIYMFNWRHEFWDGWGTGGESAIFRFWFRGLSVGVYQKCSSATVLSLWNHKVCGCSSWWDLILCFQVFFIKSSFEDCQF
jgi:hypothetical protein